MNMGIVYKMSLLLVVTVCLTSGLAGADVRNPVQAVEVATAPVQDGVISAQEYGALAPLSMTADNAFQVDWGGTVLAPAVDDLSYDVYAAWDSEALYIALDVTDNEVLTAATLWGGGEMAQIVLAEVGAVAREAGSLSDVGILPDGAIAWQNNAGGGDVSWGAANITGAWETTATGYVIELRYPWSDFKITLPTIEIGAQLVAMFALVDYDAAALHAFMISSGGPEANPFENHKDLSTVTLVGAGSGSDVPVAGAAALAALAVAMLAAGVKTFKRK